MLFNNDVESRQKILVVDDDPTNLHLLKTALSDLALILCSSGGLDALELASREQPSIILLDIEMPEMNGFEICTKLKNNPKTCNIAVIFVTAHNESTFEYKSLEHGGIDFIGKPIDISLCRLRVKNHLTLKQHEAALIEAKKDMQALVNQVPAYISYWSEDLNNLFNNDYNGKWLNLPHTATVTKHASEILPANLYFAIMERLELDQLHHEFEIKFANNLHQITYAQVHLTMAKSGTKFAGLLLTMTDISSIKQAKKQLNVENNRLRIMLNSIGDAVIATDKLAQITFMNPIAERLTGWVNRDAMGLHIDEVMNLCDASTKYKGQNPVTIALKEKRTVGMALNCQLTSQDGTVYRVEDSASPIKDDEGNITGAIIVFHDCSESVAMAVKMSHLANHDQLTDLPNRILLHDRVTHACNVARAHNKLVALLLIDIDHFKYVNDSFGHAHGDLIIKLVAKRLQSLIDPNATLARVGGDEFVLLLPHIKSASQIDTIANDIVQSTRTPFRIKGNEHTLSVSIGISIFPTDATRCEEMMTHADASMYRAKDLGRNRFCYFSQELENQLVKRNLLITQLRTAIDTEAIEVYFQPKLDLQTMEIVGAEALARLSTPDGQMISPLDFIPLAEEVGFIHELGKIILLKSCAVAKRWNDEGHDLRIAVNIAAKQFTNPNFCETVTNALELTGLRSKYLELEVTESALMHDFDEALSILNTLSSIGLTIAIDDFGTGYSSLSYLKYFPVNTLKIDQSFVKDMFVDEQSLDIVKAVVNLGKSLNLTLVAEGIESQQQLEQLQSLTCEQGQGYLFSKPLLLEQFNLLLQKQ
ncbi:EAL domain-containing protein [Shewanella mesophila]|uniref:EAL domain-containing protein n=1 Tax=Shewanella mesophila TaxID=2864208 RepID=UPI001C65ADC7|nr:EAL domain-containing protein [Shewanella mesophila]QYJ85360.1 EAL domain-containing protein [Shewanella mesophila]